MLSSFASRAGLWFTVFLFLLSEPAGHCGVVLGTGKCGRSVSSFHYKPQKKERTLTIFIVFTKRKKNVPPYFLCGRGKPRLSNANHVMHYKTVKCWHYVVCL